MTIDAFILNWPGKTAAAERHEAAIAPLVSRCTVVNADPAADARHASWLNIGDVWGHQIPIALERFAAGDADLMLWVCADATLDFAAMLPRAVNLMEHYPIGVYAPNFDHCGWPYERGKLRAIPSEVDLYHVPQTDGIILMIRGSVARATPTIGMRENRMSWGIDNLLMAVAYAKNLWVVRDYRFKAIHDKSRNYDGAAARRDMREYLAKLPHDLQENVARTIAATKR